MTRGNSIKEVVGDGGGWGGRGQDYWFGVDWFAFERQDHKEATCYFLKLASPRRSSLLPSARPQDVKAS